MKYSNLLLAALTATALTFTACGGGDSDPTPPADETPAGGTTSTVLSGTISADKTLDASKAYEIKGLVLVKGATLTIPAGTTLFGAEGENYMVIAKGAKIDAQGTAAKPIVFTSKTAHSGGTGAAGQWGGLTILGNAPVNETMSYEVDENNADFAFGGTMAADNSGTLTHVKVLNSGYAVVENKEINGLSLCGVGSGTTINNITVENSQDDGVEIWGGTVDLDHVTIEGAQDDSLDLDSGYTGTVSNLTIVQTGSKANAGIEMSSGDSATHYTNPTIRDFTITTAAVNAEGGIYLKDKEVTGTFSNGTVNHTAATGSKGSIYVKKSMNNVDELSFTNVTLNPATVTGKSDDPATTDVNEDNSDTVALVKAAAGV